MVIKFESGFEILRISDLNYEGMTVEIQFQEEPIAQLNMDKGRERMEVELFTKFADKKFVPKFPLKDFMDALDMAKKLLNEY